MDKPVTPTNEVSTPENKSKLRLYFGLFLLFVLVGAGGYGYYTYTEFISLQKQARVAIAENKAYVVELDSYESLKKEIVQERDRCKDFVLQEVGNFEEFSYCRSLLQWIERRGLAKWEETQIRRK